MSHYFNIHRFLKLLKLELFRSFRGIFIAFEITFGMLFFVGLLMSIIVEDSMVFFEHTRGYAFTLIIGGFVLSSLAFNDLSHSLKSSNYLTLPTSTFEKFLSMWLLTSVGWIVFFSFTYYLYTVFVANPIGTMIDANMRFEDFDPLSDFALSVMQYYFVLQGLFLVGASHFNGYVFPKTIFTVILVAIVAGTTFYFIMGDLMQDDQECLSDNNPYVDKPIYKIWLLAQWAFWWLLAPFCWVVTYLGLKDREV
ncbi:hypothetical protein [Reichenbachiella sp.]|uniref:hypothetical protein n=1 Tax=Reichenbachiella sp. TaxID=2184521 RepID=UPI003BB0F91E